MFRVDKITLSLLEQTALAYRRGDYDRIPILRMLTATPETLAARAEALQAQLNTPTQTKTSRTYVGGGTMPNRKIPTVILAFEGDPQHLEAHFRTHRIIGRIEAERFVLDMRTIDERDFEQIVHAAETFYA
jgi:L-seryl-tRNA(Ser) seleniumtransferase